MRTRRLGACLLTALLAASAASGEAGDPLAALEPAPPDADAGQIVRLAASSTRADRTYIEATMTVESAGISRDRVVVFRSWDDREERRSFIRILSPDKDAGTGFLKLPPNLWMYEPRREQVTRIPPSELREPWMGGDFTHDDLVYASSETDDYDHVLLGIDPRPTSAEGVRAYVIESTPRAGALVSWAKIIGWVETGLGTPLRREFYDESGEKRRILTFDDVREVGERRVPHRWTMRSLSARGRKSRIQLERIQFDPSFDESVFTTRQLKAQGD